MPNANYPCCCIDCKYGNTEETKTDWIETFCVLDNRQRSPFTKACKKFVPKMEVAVNDSKK